MALSVGTPPPGTSRMDGWGTCAKEWVGIIFTCMSVSIGSTRSATTTTRYCGASSLTPVKIWSGPARSKTVSPGYSTKADRKSTRLNSSHTVIYTLSLHDALPFCHDYHPVLWGKLAHTGEDLERSGQVEDR